MSKIYFLSDYNWCVGELISSGPKNNKIKVPEQRWMSEYITTAPKEKCAFPDEVVCVVWETWKGRNGRGGYRVERELYPEDRVPAPQVHYQVISSDAGRVTETAYGVKQ